MAYQLSEALVPFCTARQLELLRAWEEHASLDRAAEALGCHRKNFSQARGAVEKKAARMGVSASDAFGGAQVPPGYVLRGQSALVDAKGNMRERWDKTKQEGLDAEDEIVLPDPKLLTKVSTMRDADGKAVIQWQTEKADDREREKLWLAFAEELAQKVERVEPVPAPAKNGIHHLHNRSSLLAGYPVGDHHLGMLAWWMETGDSYDLKIGERLLNRAFDHLTGLTAGAETALVAFLGDFMHYDTFDTVTPTSRNILDSDTRYSKMAWAAVRVMRYAVDAALRAHQKVRVIVEAGNHDLSSTVFLAMCLKVAYENEPRVEVDTSPKHFHYYQFGKVLIGTHHGHGTPMKNLPMIMATDCKEAWGSTEHRHWWTGHIHTSKHQAALSAQDFSGCTVESFRVLPPSDAWAAQKGYRAMRDMKAFVFHDELGEMCRLTVNPKMLEENDDDER